MVTEGRSELFMSKHLTSNAKEGRRPRRSPGSANGNVNPNHSAVAASASGKSRFAAITTIMFVIAIADVIFVWKSVDNFSDDTSDPSSLQFSGAEAGLHHLHEKKRMKTLQKHSERIRRDEERSENKNAAPADEETKQYVTMAMNTNTVPIEIDLSDVPIEINLNDVKPTEVDKQIKKVLDAAGVKIDAELASQLPKWDDVVSMYGPSPIIYGLEKCEPYRQAVKAEDRMLGPAGIFNTGTNLLFELLKENCDIKEARKKKREPKRNGMRWQAPWGKHNPPTTHRFKNVAKMWGTGINHTDFFPVVMIKDPYSWMGSECRHKYYAFWAHDDDHCPNLVKYNVPDHMDPAPVRVKYAMHSTEYKSLIEVWNKWYTEYEEQKFPRLHTRFEDLLFHGEEVIKTVCECVGGIMSDKFVYIEGSAKENGMAIHNGAYGLVKALLQYGSPEKRLEGFTDRDRVYASKFVNSDLMQRYGYSAPPLPT